MKAERRRRLLDETVGYLVEAIHDDEELFHVLHETLGMTQKEIRECGIDCLDAFFQTDPDYDRLMEKVERCYKDFKWMWNTQKYQDEVYEAAGKISAVTVCYRLLKSKALSKESVRWLARFRNPLAVVSDAWELAFDFDRLLAEDRLGMLVEDVRARGNAEEDYELDDEDGA